MAIESILIAGCTDSDRRLICDTLASDGRQVALADSLPAACELLRSGPRDLVIVDSSTLNGAPRRGGEEIRAIQPDVPIVLAASGRQPSRFAAVLQMGACDLLHCPVAAQRLRMLIDRLDQHCRLVEQNRYLWDELERVYGCDGLISADPAVAELMRQATRVAQTDAAVLIQGEQGTEKELVALYIHRSGDRRDGPFIRFNCRSISPQQCARELFGSGRTPPGRPGRIELAAGGSLYLEEITAVPVALQARLLRAIEDAACERQEARTVARAARVIASTSCDPYDKIRRGQLREDLFFRLNVVPIFLPPLRRRPGDIPLLADHFARKWGAPHGASDLVSAQQWARMEAHTWPGNVSELRHAMRLAAFRAGLPEPAPFEPWETD